MIAFSSRSNYGKDRGGRSAGELARSCTGKNKPTMKVERWTLILIDFEGKIPIVKWVSIGAAYSVLSEVGSSVRRGDQQVQKDRDISARNI